MDGDDFASIQLLGTLNEGFKSNDFNEDVAKYFNIFQEDSVTDHSFTINGDLRIANTFSTANNIDDTQACHVVFHLNNSQQLGSIREELPQMYDPTFQQQQSAVDVQYLYYDNNYQPFAQIDDTGNNNLLVAQKITNNDNVVLVHQSKPSMATFIKCQVRNCNLKYKSQETHDNHARCHSQNGTSGFNCYLCEFSRKKWSSLANHLWSAHKVDMELSKCSKCEYRTYSQSILERVHLATHSEERNFICETCDKRFKTIKQLQNHKSTHNGDLKPKPRTTATKSCDTCHKELKDKKSLDKHIRAVHDRVKNHACTLCSYKADTKGTLLTHIRAQHTGEKPHRCQFDKCQFSTSDHNSFRRHKLRHEGHYPYNCPFCEYRSIQSCSYKDHLKKQHQSEPKLSEYLFTCENCGFTTINKSKLAAHQFACNKSDAENNMASSDECSIGSASSITSLIVTSNAIASAKSGGSSIVNSIISTSSNDSTTAKNLLSKLGIDAQHSKRQKLDNNDNINELAAQTINDIKSEYFPQHIMSTM